MKSLARLPQLGNIWLGEDKASKILVEMTHDRHPKNVVGTHIPIFHRMSHWKPDNTGYRYKTRQFSLVAGCMHCSHRPHRKSRVAISRRGWRRREGGWRRRWRVGLGGGKRARQEGRGLGHCEPRWPFHLLPLLARMLEDCHWSVWGEPWSLFSFRNHFLKGLNNIKASPMNDIEGKNIELRSLNNMDVELQHCLNEDGLFWLFASTVHTLGSFRERRGNKLAKSR